MGRVAYVNGRFVPHGEASVHIEDRGYQFADAVYEVWAVFGGRLADPEGHFTRLERSLSELSIPMPMSRKALTIVLKEALRRNRVTEGLLYLQVSRGVAPRDHAFPKQTPPSVVITASMVDRTAAEARAAKGVGVVTTPENRWGRCDIKTVGLLPNALAKQKAREAGAVEAWFVDELGFVTEGASSNAWIVDRDGRLRTRDTNANILRGVTRRTLLDVIAEEEGLQVDERPFTPADAHNAKEAFITGAGSLVLPVVSLDGKPIGDGKPGPVATRLRRLYIERAKASAI